MSHFMSKNSRIWPSSRTFSDGLSRPFRVTLGSMTGISSSISSLLKSWSSWFCTLFSVSPKMKRKNDLSIHSLTNFSKKNIYFRKFFRHWNFCACLHLNELFLIPFPFVHIWLWSIQVLALHPSHHWWHLSYRNHESIFGTALLFCKTRETILFLTNMFGTATLSRHISNCRAFVLVVKHFSFRKFNGQSVSPRTRNVCSESRQL